jgi:hypothetical protein
LQLDGGGRKGYRENQTIYWSRYERLEKSLLDADILVDLTKDTSLVRNLEPNMIFLASGHAYFEPDWSNWQSGVSMIGLVSEFISQLGALNAPQQPPPNETGVVPASDGLEVKNIVNVDQAGLSQLVKAIPVSEPPQTVRRLFKPAAVNIRISLGESRDLCTLESSCALEHFTPHRLQPYLMETIEEDIYVLGLVRQREDKLLRFIPLTLSVCVKGRGKEGKRVRK